MCDVHFWFCTSILWCLPPLLCVGVGGALSFNLKFKFIQVFFKIKFFQGIFLFSFKFFLIFFFFWCFFMFYMLIMLVVCCVQGLLFICFANFSQNIVFSKLQPFCMMKRRSKLFVIINACNCEDLIFIAWILNLNRTHILAKRRFFHFHFFTLSSFLVENVVK